MAEGGRNTKRFQYCTDASRQEILDLRALQGHSRRNPIDPSSQDKVLNPSDIFEDIYHIGCAINVHSIINQGLIPGGQDLSKRQTVFFTSVNPMNKEHKDPVTVDLEAPRLAQYMHTAWKKHHNTVYWVGIRLAQKKGLQFCQTRSNAIILYDTLSAYCILKAQMMETGEIKNEKVYASPRPPPKISFKDNSMKELGSEVAGGGEHSQQTQPKTKNPIVRTRRLINSCVSVSVDRLDQDKNADENRDADRIRTVTLVGCEQSIDLFTQREEIDIDFRECLDCHMHL